VVGRAGVQRQVGAQVGDRAPRCTANAGRTDRGEASRPIGVRRHHGGGKRGADLRQGQPPRLRRGREDRPRPPIPHRHHRSAIQQLARSPLLHPRLGAARTRHAVDDEEGRSTCPRSERADQTAGTSGCAGDAVDGSKERTCQTTARRLAVARSADPDHGASLDSAVNQVGARRCWCEVRACEVPRSATHELLASPDTAPLRRR
jgi:hypothetical protein